jgi:hypothetical protein
MPFQERARINSHSLRHQMLTAQGTIKVMSNELVSHTT